MIFCSEKVVWGSLDIVCWQSLSLSCTSGSCEHVVVVVGPCGEVGGCWWLDGWLEGG